MAKCEVLLTLGSSHFTSQGSAIAEVIFEAVGLLHQVMTIHLHNPF